MIKMQQYDNASIRTTIPRYEELEKKTADGTTIILKPFAIRQSLETQLQNFVALRRSDPSRAKEIYDLNEYILSLSEQGALRKLINAVESVGDATHILTYYVVKAFKAAILGGHLMVVSFFIDKGYPFNTARVPHVLLEVMAQTLPSLPVNIAEDVPTPAISPPLTVFTPHSSKRVTEEALFTLVEFLINKNKSVNSNVHIGMSGHKECEIVNLPAKGNYFTPLHVAIRYGLFSVIDLLLQNGADVNAVADGDTMPLGLAYKFREVHQDGIRLRQQNSALKQLSLSTVSSTTAIVEQSVDSLATEQRHQDLVIADRIDNLIRELIARGARETWRRDTAVIARPSTSNGTDLQTNLQLLDAQISVSNIVPAVKKMVGFSGTVSKETTPTVEEMLNAIQTIRLDKSVGGSSDHMITSSMGSGAVSYEADDGAQIFSTG